MKPLRPVPPTGLRRAYTADEFCSAYRVGRSRFQELAKSGRLRTYKDGKRRMVSAEAAEEYQRSLEQRTGTDRGDRPTAIRATVDAATSLR
jgi:excisionase family DNA binding protein